MQWKGKLEQLQDAGNKHRWRERRSYQLGRRTCDDAVLTSQHALPSLLGTKFNFDVPSYEASF